MADQPTEEMVGILRSAAEGDVLEATIEGEPWRLRVIEELSMVFPPHTKGVKARRVEDDEFRMVCFAIEHDTGEPRGNVFARRSFASGFSTEHVDELELSDRQVNE